MSDADGTTGTGSPEWMAQLPAEMKADEDLSGFKTIGELATAWKDGRVSQNELDSYKTRTFVPGEGATEEEVKTYREKMGIPEEYSFEGKKLAEMELKGELADVLQETFKDTSLSTTQADKVIEAVSKIMGNMDATGQRLYKETNKAAEKVFRESWGDKYDENKAGVSATVLQYGGEKFAKQLDKTGFGNDPLFVTFVHEMNKIVGDHVSAETGDAGGTGRKEPVGIRYPSMEGMGSGR